MRWLHYDPLCVEEVEFRTSMLAKFDRFWREFAERVAVLENALLGGTAWDWHRWLSDLLSGVDPRWRWELVPDSREDHWALAVTTTKHRTSRPMLREFLATAPQIPGWTFHQWLPPMPYPLARRWARQRSQSDCDQLAVKVLPSSAGRVGLEFVPAPDSPPTPNERWLAAAYAASEAILGEAAFDQWVCSVTIGEPSQDRGWWSRQRKQADKESLHSMNDLAAVISEYVGIWRESLPPTRLKKLIDTRGWTTVEIEPTGESVGTRYYDLRLLTASVVALPILQAAHSDRRFQSNRHSRFAERFCYVQWQLEAVSDEEMLSRREAIDQAITAAVKDCDTAVVIGGGIGEEYLYFDLAITDTDSAIPLIRQTLLPHSPPRNTWLRFHDEELANEWVGIHPDAQPPPRY